MGLEKEAVIKKPSITLPTFGVQSDPVAVTGQLFRNICLSSSRQANKTDTHRGCGYW